MTRLSVLLTVAVLAEATVAHGQGVAPGGPVGNSTGIGSGVGPGAIGTAPRFPNGTAQPTLPPPPPPGGLPPSGRADGTPRFPPPSPRLSSPHVQTPPRYPQPLDPNDPTTPVPSRVPQAK